MRNHLWWSEFGNAPHPDELPPVKIEAHLAIMEGKHEKRKDEQKKGESN